MTLSNVTLSVNSEFVPPPTGRLLSENNPVYRVGSTVLRPAGTWTPSVNALLRHLEKEGFAGGPTPVGDGIDQDNRQVLTFVEGDEAPTFWSDDGIIALGHLLRDMHAAARSFTPSPGSRWQPWWTHQPKDDPIISHGDVGPWNLVARNGVPVAYIDWDLAGPVDRLDEVADAARLNCQLHSDDVAEGNNLPPVETRAHHLRLFADAYGLDREERSSIIGRMLDIALRGAANDCDEAGITPDFVGPHPMVWGIAWQARGGVWILDHREPLEAALLE